MYYVNNHNEHDPAVNLALEEYVLRGAPAEEDLLLLYVNAPSIVMGRHQNAWEEINLGFVEQHGIQVARRLSGGGTVYHDLGNLNFSYLTPARPEDFRNFKKFTGPAVRTLELLGVPAVLNARSDLLIDGKKISGNAQYISKGRMVSHGTLLFDADLAHVSEALRVKGEEAITSKAIKSVRSPVTNIREHLRQPLTIEQFRDLLLAQFFPHAPEEGAAAPLPEYPLSAEDWAAIRRLADERYRSWDWTFGYSPDFRVEKCQQFPGGKIQASLEIQRGMIHAITLTGDFFQATSPQVLEGALKGVRYRREEIVQALKNGAVAASYPSLDAEAFGAFFFSGLV